MFVCSIPVVAIVAGVATALTFVVEARSWGWYVLVMPLSPGWLLPALLASQGTPSGFNWDDFLTPCSPTSRTGLYGSSGSLCGPTDGGDGSAPRESMLDEA